MRRIHAFILILMAAAAACGDDPQGPEPPPAAQRDHHIMRFWSIAEVENMALDDSVILQGIAREGEIIEALNDMGPLGIHPPGEGPNAIADVFSNDVGTTYWVGAQAPHEPLGVRSAIGSESELSQQKRFRKVEDEARLEYHVTRVVLEAIDDNGIDPTPSQCPWRHPALPIEQDCADVMLATVDFDIIAYRSYQNAQGVLDSLVPFWQTGGSVELTGYRGNFRARAVTAAGASRSLWRLSDFDQISDPNAPGRGLKVRLRNPITLAVPLDTMPVDATFMVYFKANARARNRRQSESYLSAYFRDPEKTTGVSHEYDGLEFLEPLEDPIVPTPSVPCTAGASPAGGTLQFDASDYAEPEHPGATGWVVVTREGGSNGVAAARVVTNGGTAAATSDYESVDTYVEFADGEEGSRLVQVPILADTIIESDETVIVTLEAIPGCGALGSPSSATLTILDDDDPWVPPTFTVGGTVTGLEGDGLVLSNVSTDHLTITDNGPFVFGREYADGSRYIVRLDTQPTNPIQVCTVTNGEGDIAGVNVTTIEVDCVTPPPTDDSLDPDFGESGRVTVGSITGITDVAVQADGKIVAVGDDALARYNADGSLDATFGAGGEVSPVFNNTSDVLNAVAIQPDGAIVVAGYTNDPAGVTGQDLAIARFTTDGSLDASFGTGGIVLADVAGSTDRAWDVAIQDDGSIVVGGHAGVNGQNDFAVARFTSAGEPDNGFGTDGVVTTNIAGDTDFGYAVVVQPDGKIVLAGRVARSGGADPDMGLVRYEADGTPDTGFGTDGIVRIVTDDVWDEVSDIAIQPDGYIVVGGYSRVPGQTFEFLVARFDPAGNLDPSFGGTGIVTNSFSTLGDFAHGLALQDDGKIVLVGQASNSSNSNFAVERFNPDGTVDTDFGTDGQIQVEFFGDSDIAYAAAIQADGQIVVAGLAINARQRGVGMIRIVP